MDIDGQCHCGRISFTAEIDPQRVGVCHCTDCQVLSSSAFRLSVVTERANVQVTGEPKTYAKTADSGATRLQHFCPDCGTPLFTSGPDADVGHLVIRWGSIRQRQKLKPGRQIWCGSAVPWIDELKTVPASAAG